MAASEISPPARAGRRAAIYPYLLLASGMLCWSCNWVIGRAMRDSIPPIALNFWRWTLAVAILTPFALPRLRGKGAAIRRGWRILVLLGLIGVALFQLIIYFGLRYTGAVNATLMNSAAPLFIIAMAWLIDGERVTPRQLAGMVISFCGIIVILNRGDLGQIAHFHFNPGDLLILAGMPVWGLYAVLLRRRPRELDNIALLYLIALAGLIALAPAYAIESMVGRAAHLTWATVGAVAYTGFFASVVAYICWNHGVQLVGPNRAGFTMHLLPAFATVLAVILLGEKVHVFHAVGIATIIFGVWLASSAKSAQGAP